MDFKIFPFELKASDMAASRFSGYCNAFCNIDAAMEIVAPGAFKDTISQFLAVGFVGGLNHDWSNPIGKPLSAKEDPTGLFVEGKVSATVHGKDCMVLLKDDVIKKMSIGYRVLGDMELQNAEEVAKFWQDMSYTPNATDIARAAMGCRVLTKLHLYEFSPVTVPANDLADITAVKRLFREDIETERDLEKALRDGVRFSRKDATAIVLYGFKGLQRDADEANPEPEVTPVQTQEQEPPATEDPPTPEPIVETPPEKTIVHVGNAAHQGKVQACYQSYLDSMKRSGITPPA